MTIDPENKGYVCCFCGADIEADDPLAVRVALTNLRDGHDSEAPLQQVYAHGRCLAASLIERVGFDPDALRYDPDANSS